VTGHPKILNVELGSKSYPIFIGSELLSQKSFITDHIHGQQVMIVSNTTVAPIYLDQVARQLDGYNVEFIILPDGEQYKTLETVNTIFDALLKSKFDRS
jgi:3-dehydroquinate synthase